MPKTSEEIAALVQAAEGSEDVKTLMADLDDEEVEWMLEDSTLSSRISDPDPTPPDREAVAKRDAWLKDRVDRIVKGGPTTPAALGPVVRNLFCPTGQGGGIDPTCGAGKSGGGSTISSATQSAHALPKTAKDAGKAMADALATIDPKLSSDPALHEKVAANWARNLRGKVVAKGEDFNELSKAVQANLTSSEFQKAVAVHGAQAVVLVNDPQERARAKSVGASALVFTHSIEPLKHVSQPPRPGAATSEDQGGAAAVLRHEYAHRVLENLPKGAKESWERVVRFQFHNADDIKKELTIYAGRAAAKSTSKDEVFTEAFTIGTSPHYDPSQFSDRARSVIAEAVKAGQTPK